jgi:hypothetical protein
VRVADECGNGGCPNDAAKKGVTGPPRRYCSDRCRQAAYRQRREGQALPTAPTDPVADALTDAIVHFDTMFAALPGTTKRGTDGQLLMRIVAALRRAAADRQ